MQLYTPLALVLWVLVPLVVWAMVRRGNFANLRFSSVESLQSVGRGIRVQGRWLLLLLRVGCLVCLILALARPREGNQQHKITRNAAVMQLVIDRSGSMRNRMDYDGQILTRFEVVKRVLNDFIQGGNGLPGRENDLLGLTTFARYADTICPLVYSHDILSGFLKEIKTVQYRSSEDGTFIDEGINLAAARLKNAEHNIAQRNARLGESEASKFKINSRVIILLTDGQSDRQSNPLAAVELAKDWGIKIYTIGIGNGADEYLLREIAQRTGGFYGRADDAKALRAICDRIDEEEKSEIESIEYSIYEERFMPWALAALCCLVVEMGLATTVLRKIP